MNEFDPTRNLQNIDSANLLKQLDGGLSHLHNINQDMAKFQRNERERQERNAGRFDAADAFKYLMMRVKTFQAALENNEEVGIQLANYGLAAQIHVREITFQNPNILEFIGVNSDNHKVALVQHISQLNFLLVAIKPFDATPYRIGFGR